MAAEFKHPWIPRRLSLARGQTVDVYEIAPMKTLFPTPVVIAPGWVEVPESWRKHAEVIADYGFHVILYDAPHGLQYLVAPEKRKFKLQYQKMETLVAVVHALKLRAVDVIARSEGAAWALRAKKRYPTLIRNLVLENPAGLIGRDNLLSFFLRWLQDQKQMKRNELGDPPPYTPVPGDRVIARDRYRAFRAVWELIHSDLRRELAFAVEHGGVAILTTEKDRLFPPEQIYRNVREIFREKGLRAFPSFPGPIHRTFRILSASRRHSVNCS